MRAGEVLDAQGDLIERLQSFKAFRASVEAWAKLEMTANGDRQEPQTNTAYSEMIARATNAAYAYRVSADMTDMVTYAASQLDPDEEFDADAAPTGCGFVAFDKPLVVNDIRGKQMLIHYLIWGPISVGFQTGGGTRAIQMVTFNDLYRQPDEIAKEDWKTREVDTEHPQERWEAFEHERGRWAPVGLEMLFHGQALGQDSLAPTDAQAARYLIQGVKAMPGTNPRRYLQALWLLLNQTVTKVEEEHPDRPARRRAMKRRLPQKVTVIRLRREVSTLGREPGESQVEWQHRWIVRGHWRWQACGPQRSERRRIWINPFVKGPEDKPLVQSEKVYSLER